jgi:hypothetical protein
VSFKNKLTNQCAKSLNTSLTRLINRARVTCLFDISELKFGIAYCYNGGSESAKPLDATVVASAFIDATSELSANDIDKNIGIIKNESIPIGKASSIKTATKKTIKVSVGKRDARSVAR